jgi:hypothetical protein
MTKEFFERGKQIAKWADKQGETNMPCSGNCNQGRSCDCGNNKSDRAVVIVVTLLLVAVVSMGFGVYKLIHGTKGQDCAVEVQFGSGVKATYLGTSV